MPSVGDKVRIQSTKGSQPPREGVVLAVSGSLLRIRWSNDEESALFPGPGAVTVVGRSRTRTATKSAKAAKTPTKKAVPAKKVAKVSSAKKETKASPGKTAGKTKRS